jgi:hypothetical protein
MQCLKLHSFGAILITARLGDFVGCDGLIWWFPDKHGDAVEATTD